MTPKFRSVHACPFALSKGMYMWSVYSLIRHNARAQLQKEHDAGTPINGTK